MTALRDAFEAWCAGDAGLGGPLPAELAHIGSQVLSRYAHQAVDAGDVEDHTQTMLGRLWNQRQDKLDEAALATDAHDRIKLLRQAAVRGATVEAMAQALGRPLDEAEQATAEARLASDGKVRAYFKQAYRNRLNRLLQQNKRQTQLDSDRPVATSAPAEPEFSAEALDLLERLLGDFEDWGNDRSPGDARPGTRNMQSLEELAWAGRDGLSAREVTARLHADLDAEALRKAGAARGRAWRRARERFHVFIEETRLKKEDRPLVPEVQRAFDDRYRLRRRAGVRKRAAARPPVQRSEP